MDAEAIARLVAEAAACRAAGQGRAEVTLAQDKRQPVAASSDYVRAANALAQEGLSGWAAFRFAGVPDGD